MGLTGAERQARWRAKHDAKIEALRKAAGGSAPEALAEALAEITRLRSLLAATAREAPATPDETICDLMDCCVFNQTTLNPIAERSLAQRLELADQLDELRAECGLTDWYNGEYTSDFDCYYNDPRGDVKGTYCIEPVRGKGYTVRDPDDKIIGEGMTLDAAKEFAEEHMARSKVTDQTVT